MQTIIIMGVRTALFSCQEPPGVWNRCAQVFCVHIQAATRSRRVLPPEDWTGAAKSGLDDLIGKLLKNSCRLLLPLLPSGNIPTEDTTVFPRGWVIERNANSNQGRLDIKAMPDLGQRPVGVRGASPWNNSAGRFRPKVQCRMVQGESVY